MSALSLMRPTIPRAAIAYTIMAITVAGSNTKPEPLSEANALKIPVKGRVRNLVAEYRNTTKELPVLAPKSLKIRRKPRSTSIFIPTRTPIPATITDTAPTSLASLPPTKAMVRAAWASPSAAG